MKAIGVDLGGTNSRIAVVDDKQGIIERVSYPTQADKGIDFVFGQLSETINTFNEQHSLIGVGFALPGMVSLDQTTVYNPPNLPGWETVYAAEQIRKRTALPCRIENDANIAALGSSFYGVAKERGFSSFITITLGTGVGGGVILDGELFKGPKGMAGELGHMIINYDCPKSNGRTPGTVEAYLGQRFLSRRAMHQILQHPDNPLYQSFKDQPDLLEPIHLYEEANNGNTLAQSILQECGQYLGYAIINYTHIFDVRKYVLSGGVSGTGQWILESAQKTIQEYLMKPYLNGHEICIEPSNTDSALLGAAALAFKSFA
jgi:glucokinase